MLLTEDGVMAVDGGGRESRYYSEPEMDVLMERSSVGGGGRKIRRRWRWGGYLTGQERRGQGGGKEVK